VHRLSRTGPQAGPARRRSTMRAARPAPPTPRPAAGGTAPPHRAPCLPPRPFLPRTQPGAPPPGPWRATKALSFAALWPARAGGGDAELRFVAEGAPPGAPPLAAAPCHSAVLAAASERWAAELRRWGDAAAAGGGGGGAGGGELPAVTLAVAGPEELPLALGLLYAVYHPELGPPPPGPWGLGDEGEEGADDEEAAALGEGDAEAAGGGAGAWWRRAEASLAVAGGEEERGEEGAAADEEEQEAEELALLGSPGAAAAAATARRRRGARLQDASGGVGTAGGGSGARRDAAEWPEAALLRLLDLAHCCLAPCAALRACHELAARAAAGALSWDAGGRGRACPGG
jgi:hypothetical protein